MISAKFRPPSCCIRLLGPLCLIDPQLHVAQQLFSTSNMSHKSPLTLKQP